jgi:MFS family permease
MSVPMNIEIQKSLKHNLLANLMDGGFFGFALGFASFVTIIPLFVSTMTNSAILIGLIPAIHAVGWQLPQLFLANRVARQSRYKPMVTRLTIQERLPFVGLALVAWFLPVLGVQTALLITFALLIWQGLGGGFTANPWQAMIGKIIPSDRRGTFFGAQSSAANLLASLGAVLAGVILETLDNQHGFTLCFILACVCMVISWFFLASTREPANVPVDPTIEPINIWSRLGEILRRDKNFRWFLVVRMLSQLAVMGFAFYTVYAVHELKMSELEVGFMTAVLLGTQIAVNPIMGWIGDRWSHRNLMEIGLVAAVVSTSLAWWASSSAWFIPVFFLAGVANVAVWTIGLTMILEFGNEADRPAYIGMANTLVAPATILAPLFGGWLADQAGYPAAFLVSAIGGVITLVVLQLRVRDPKRMIESPTIESPTI